MTFRMLNREEQRISALESFSFPLTQMFLNALTSDIVKHVPHNCMLTACSSIRMCRFMICMRTLIVGGAALLQLILLLQHNYIIILILFFNNNNKYNNLS